MGILSEKKVRWFKRKVRVRKSVFGSPECPRLSVFRSTKHIYAQVIDDIGKTTLASASSLDKELRAKKCATVQTAKEVGNLLAKRAKEKGIQRVVFDRNGFLYHGQLKALADAAREGGLSF